VAAAAAASAAAVAVARATASAARDVAAASRVWGAQAYTHSVGNATSKVRHRQLLVSMNVGPGTGTCRFSNNIVCRASAQLGVSVPITASAFESDYYNFKLK
jgi:hypothetical protein